LYIKPERRIMTLNRRFQPSLKEISEIQLPAIQLEKLTNGLPLSYINIGSQELVKLQISIPAGIVHQNKTLLAFFTNKMLKEGSKNHSAAQIAQKMDYYGAYFESRITRDQAYINLFCLNKYLENILPLVAEILSQPTFSEDEFITLCEQEKQSYQIRMQKVKTKALKEFNTRIFGEHHPYGSFAELSDYDQLDIIELKKFHQDHYQVQNWRLYLSGYVNSSVKQLVNEYFGSIPMSQADEANQNGEFKTESHRPDLFHSLQNGALQSALKVGKLSIDRLHTDYPTLSLAQTILGGYFGSRLMQNIREEKGYTYGIYSSIQHFQQASVFGIGSEVGSQVVKATLDEVDKELYKLRTELVGGEELQLVKNYMSGSLLRSLNGPFSLGEMMRMLHEFQLPEDYYSQYAKAVQNVSAEQVLQVADKYLNETEMTKVVVGSIIE